MDHIQERLYLFINPGTDVFPERKRAVFVANVKAANAGRPFASAINIAPEYFLANG